MTLASALGDADCALRAAEVKVEALLSVLFPAGWQGWQFFRAHDNRYAIDVYQANATREAIRQLFAAGFTSVTVHVHAAKKLITCICRTWDAY